MRCANHPNTPTRLRCGRCGKPICTRCANTTSVGLRCSDCARGPQPVMYQTDTTILGRALGAGLAAAVVLGVAWGVLYRVGFGFYDLSWDFWFMLITAFVVGEVVSWAGKRRRGSNLQLLAIGAVLLAFVISRGTIILRASQALTAADVSAIIQQTIAAPVLLLFLALACLIAWRRFR
ncbi:MAG: B-box zinc finger protein [Chloroflexia bacterium]